MNMFIVALVCVHTPLSLFLCALKQYRGHQDTVHIVTRATYYVDPGRGVSSR